MSCQICGSTDLRDHAARRRAHCASCGSLERHRALATQFRAFLEHGHGRRSLEIGPVSRMCFKGYLERHGWKVVSIDKWRRGNPYDPRDVRFVDLELDLVDMSRFADGTFDLVIAQHVIEEVPEYRQALDEIRRVVQPGGLALLEIPFDRRRERSQPQPPDRFGNVWRFGIDLPDEVDARFDAVEAHELREGDYRGEVMACQVH